MNPKFVAFIAQVAENTTREDQIITWLMIIGSLISLGVVMLGAGSIINALTSRKAKSEAEKLFESLPADTQEKLTTILTPAIDRINNLANGVEAFVEFLREVTDNVPIDSKGDMPNENRS